MTNTKKARKIVAGMIRQFADKIESGELELATVNADTSITHKHLDVKGVGWSLEITVGDFRFERF